MRVYQLKSATPLEDEKIGGAILRRSLWSLSVHLSRAVIQPSGTILMALIHAVSFQGDRPRCAYAPFSGGPRQCIGNEFALMEAQPVRATIAQRYRLLLVPGNPAEPHPIFDLRSR